MICSLWRIVWVGISTQSGRSLLTSNHCPTIHNNKSHVISKHFRIFQKKLDTKNHIVLDWLFQCYQLSLVERFALSYSHFYSKVKRCKLHLTLPLWSYSVRTDWQLSWPSSSNSIVVSTLFAAVCVVKPIAATAYWHWYCFVFTQFYVTSWTVNMNWQTAAWYSVSFF